MAMGVLSVLTSTITGHGIFVTFIIALSILLVAVDGTLDLPPRSPNCRSIQPIQFPSADFDQKDRFLAVQAAIHHAWKGYKDMLTGTATSFSTMGSEWPDDLKPLSQRGSTWLHASATLYDSLDTLYLAGLDKDFDDALDMVLRSSMTTSTTAAFSLRPTKTFEYSIRVVGGLLGAYSVSGNPTFLALAVRAADALLEGPFAASPTVLPRPFAVLAPPRYYLYFWYGSSTTTATATASTNTAPNRWEVIRCCGMSISFWWQGIGRTLQRLWAVLYSIGRDVMGEHHYNSLAGVGSFALEFEFLSKQTTAPRYREAADAIFYHVTAKSTATSMLSSNWNVMTGLPMLGSSRTLGSGSDSFYEYLLKVALLKDKDDPLRNDYMDLYGKVVDEALLSNRRLVIEAHGHEYPTEGHDRYHHLLCFVPGMLALGESQGIFAHNDESDAVLALARNLANGCHDTYTRTETGLGPEAISIATDRSFDAGYYLRPEYVESLFVLYRTTREVRYREMAWQVFQSIEKYCKVEHGYASLKDVNDPSSQLDDMPSFFIGETLKYLLLTFAPEDYVSLDDFVFTTEAHPLYKNAAIDHIPACYDLEVLLNPPIPLLLVVGSNAVALLACCCCCLWFFSFKKRSRRGKGRVKVL